MPQYNYGGYGQGFGQAYAPAPYCTPPTERVKFRYVPAGQAPDKAEGRNADGTSTDQVHWGY